jgi:M6 family metalloprotease-like protein
VLVEFTQPRPLPPGAFTGLITTGLAHWQQTIYGNLPGSVNHYYDDMSRGKFAFVPAAETQGTAGDGVVRVRLSVPHPNSKKDFALLQPYLKQALVLANPYVNFAAYDTNGDGEIQRDELNVLFVVAGYESSNNSGTPSMWAHATGLSDPPILDGKKLSRYAAIGEVQVHGGAAMPATLGVIVHELGHTALSLPDLYKGPTPLGSFCVMAGGSWGRRDGEPSGSTPVAMSAWSRVKTGFITPTVIEPGAPQQAIALAQTAGTEFLGVEVEPTIYKIETSDPDQYFLIDNRQNAGYDEGLQASLNFATVSGGLGIYRIDEALGAGSGKIAMMADNSASPSGIGTLYNLEGGKTFSPFTDPSSDDGDGMFTGLTVTPTTASGPLMVATLGFQPFGCNAITARIKEHEIHGRVFKLVAGNIFLGYAATGSGVALGVDSNATFTLHAEAPGIWSVGACP